MTTANQELAELEESLVLCPALPVDKEEPQFAALWAANVPATKSNAS